MTAVFGALACADDQPITEQPADRLITTLADADPVLRNAARDELIRRGWDARPDVLRATKSPVPAIAEGAADVLLQLPWTAPNERRRLRSALAAYGRASPEARANLLAEFARGDPAVAVRVATEDPAPVVIWTLASRLAGNAAFDAETAKRDPDNAVPAFRFAKLIDDLRKNPAFPLSPDRTAAIEASLADLAAASLENADMAQQLRQTLLMDAKWNADHDRALRLLRASANTDVTATFESIEAGEEPLLAHHAAHGPLPGLAEDVAAAEPMFAAATLARVADRADTRLLAGVCWDAVEQSFAGMEAFEIAPLRYRLGAWLERSGDYQAAGRAWAAIDGLDLPPETTVVFEAIRERYQLASNADDDVTAIAMLERMQAAVAAMRQGGFGGPPGEYEEEIAWRRWRIERVKPGAAVDEAVVARVKAFATSEARGVNCAIDLIPWLDTQGRRAEADEVFEQAYANLKDQPKRFERSERSEAQLINELSWLCTRAGRKIEESAAQQAKALKLTPGDPDHIDTMADLEAVRGNFAEAERLEILALRFKPGMPFFQDQLLRFRAGQGK